MGKHKRDLDMMTVAVHQAVRSWEEGGIPIGAALFDSDGRVVACGHNERVQTGDPTAHAEIVAMRCAGRRRDWCQLTLVTTLSPCQMCSGAVLLYRIPRVLVGEHRTFRGAEAALQEAGIEVDVLDDPRCVSLMERLQEEKPDLWAEDIGD
jgi:cytosine deaminase